MKTIISLSARTAVPNIDKLESKVQDLTDKLAAAKKELAAARAELRGQKASERKTKDAAAIRGKGKVSFEVKTSAGRVSTYTKFGEAFEALQNAKWNTSGKPCTLTAVTKEGEELLAKKSQKKGSDKPMPAVYFTAKGRVFKNAAGI